MKNFVKVLFVPLSLGLWLQSATLKAQLKEPGTNVNMGLNEKLTPDPTIVMGTLKNGMRYYIRKNSKPEKRAEMRLVVNAGSVLENDDQQGLAHFTEHMCFNGTKNFKKAELVNYLEKIGMRFGADLNAYTSFDETVYMLEVPTDKTDFVDKGLQILEDWAHNVSFENEEIDKERGVVIEEWRLGRGADDRMSQKTFPTLFYNSRYAVRLPIGKKEILEKFKYETVKQFYKDWYRPDLMAVVVVGDFDPKAMEQQVIKQFSAIPSVAAPKQRTVYDVPDNKGTLVTVATDKEAAYTLVQINYKHDKLPVGSVKDYRASMVNNLFSTMISARLDELRQKGNTTLAYSGAGISSFMREKAGYSVYGVLDEKQIEKGIETLLTENLKVKKYGFTQSELDRAKLQLEKGYESSYKERNNTESRQIAAEYIRNFLTQESIPGIAVEYGVVKQYLPGIKLEEVNALSSEWIKDENNTIVLTAPEKAGLKVPTDAEIMALVNKVKGSTVMAYEDKTVSGPLVDKVPAPGKITKEVKNDKVGTTEWTLSNGAKVILKPTDFKQDEIMMYAYGNGGTSLSPDAEMINAENSAEIINNSGLGKFDLASLGKVMAGKIANVQPFVNELYQGFNGNSSPEDIETMFQMLYLYVTAPQKDEVGYSTFKAQTLALLQSNSNDPENVFRDSVNYIMANYSPRHKPVTPASLEKLDLEKAYSYYKQRFAGANNFTYIIVGNFKPEAIRPLVESYIGGLPSGPKENWKDNNIHPPKGLVKKTIKKGVEPKSSVVMTYTNGLKYSMQETNNLNAMSKVLSIMLRESMREDKSGVYGVGAYPSVSKFPTEECKFNIAFGCAPENAAMLIETAKAQIEKLKKEGPSADNLAKVKEEMKRSRETDLKTNRFWMGALRTTNQNGTDINMVVDYGKILDNITSASIKTAANQYLNPANYAELLLVPEK